MIPIPIRLINRPHALPLTPPLRPLALKIISTTRRIMVQAPELRSRRNPTNRARIIALLSSPQNALVLESSGMNVRDAFDEARSHEGFAVRREPEVRARGVRVADAAVVVVAESTARGRGSEVRGGVREPGDGEGADAAVALPVVQPVVEDGEGGVPHFDVLVWVEEGEPGVLVAVVADAAFHCVLLEVFALGGAVGHRVRGDVGEVLRRGGDVVCGEGGVLRERGVGAVVVDVEAPDGVVVVVVGEEFV